MHSSLVNSLPLLNNMKITQTINHYLLLLLSLKRTTLQECLATNNRHHIFFINRDAKRTQNKSNKIYNNNGGAIIGPNQITLYLGCMLHTVCFMWHKWERTFKTWFCLKMRFATEIEICVIINCMNVERAPCTTYKSYRIRWRWRQRRDSLSGFFLWNWWWLS